ncbi:MAG: deoxycytidylate deaminase, partial [Candidatus Hodarchaeales archaeon]
MKYIEKPIELKEAEHFLKLAAAQAKKSTCKKSQRGAIIVRDGKILGMGYNKLVDRDDCDPCIRENIKDNSRAELCYAVHAEQVAILDAFKKYNDPKGSRIYHIKVKDGEMKPSEDISCTICSKIVLATGISEFALLQ